MRFSPLRLSLCSTLVLVLVAGLATAAQAKGAAVAAPAQGHHAAHRSHGSHSASAGGAHRGGGGGGKASGGGLAAVPTDVATPLAGTWVHDGTGAGRAAKNGSAADGFDLGGKAGRAKGGQVGGSGDLGYTTRLSSGRSK